MFLKVGWVWSSGWTSEWVVSRDTTHFDSEDDYRTGCWNVSHCQQQQSYSGLRSSGRSTSTYFWNDSWVQTFHSFTVLKFPIRSATTSLVKAVSKASSIKYILTKIIIL